jgi:hypothetical protein
MKAVSDQWSEISKENRIKTGKHETISKKHRRERYDF